MADKDKIATYYINAKELVKQNNPKAARAYVLAILNAALETYKNAKTILLKAKTQAFLDKWIEVSRELYNKGITDYVLKCFDLPTKEEKELPKVALPKPSAKSDGQPVGKGAHPIDNGEIDIAGLIDETAKTQGWCADVFERNKTAIVEVSVYKTASGTASSAVGTGFIISDKGYLLTNDHVVFDEETGSYYPKTKMSFAGDKKRYQIEVLFSDKKTDLAFCSFKPDEIKGYTSVTRIADYSHTLPGADCLVIGNAFGMGLAPFTGIVRFVKNTDGDLMYTAPSNPGDSGGPVFNRQGECIGINKSKTVTINNKPAAAYTNATPMDKINEMLYKWTTLNNIKL